MPPRLPLRLYYPILNFMKKLFLGSLFIAAIIIASIVFKDYLSFDYLHQNLDLIQSLKNENFWSYAGAFFMIYVFATAFSLPGATILTLAAGALFGFWQGFLIASFASSIGATLAFLVSRYLLRDWVKSKFQNSVEKIDANVKKQGLFYLLTLRLLPLFPFFLVNLVMGMTSIPVFTFYWISQLGMLAGTMVYVNAGVELSHLTSLKGVLSPQLLAAFTLLGLLPWFAKLIINFFKTKKIYKNFQKPKSFDYNIIVIGGGSAGLVTSYIAAAVKAKVALIEQHKMGGDCLNTGCVPSKAILKSAKIVYQAKKSNEFGVKTGLIEVDFPAVMARIKSIITKIEPHDSVDRYSKLGVDCIQGSAEIISPFAVSVNGKVLTTKNIVIASGASPAVPPFEGLESIKVRTSENLWDMQTLPKNFVVLGGGAIGCEMAQAFARLGSSVTLIEKADSLLIREEPEASNEILKQFNKENIKVLLKTEVQSFSPGQVHVKNHDGSLGVIPFDEVLIALGRKARVKGFGLEKLGIEIASSGTLDHDEFLATKYPNIFVAGDVAGPYQFTHVAAHQAWYAAVNALFSGLKRFKEDLRVIPRCTFTDPEIASVGKTEAELKKENVAFDITMYPIDDLDRAICEGEDQGFIKVLTPKGSDQILGATVAGTRAGEIIAEFVFSMRWKMGLQKILSTIHSYPTFAESSKNLAGRWRQKNVNPKILAYLEKFHAWRRS